MVNGWTLERRARQAALIRQWQPWAKSTGPRTAEGKARVARNADKGGRWQEFRDLMKEMNRMLREQRQGLKRIKP